ncbi:class D sortase [Candidatus Saccharibacteria bacterium]|nr:class D sortase [Candidatus Saccharibacteria bacterium]
MLKLKLPLERLKKIVPFDRFKGSRNPSQPTGSQAYSPAQYVNPVQADPSDPRALAASAVLARHKNTLDQLARQLKAGQDPAVVQAQWQQYYERLNDAEKQMIWQSTSAQAQPEPAPKPPSSPQAATVPPSAAAPPPSVLPAPKTRSVDDMLGAPLAIKGYGNRSGQGAGQNTPPPTPAQQAGPAAPAGEEADTADQENRSIGEIMPDRSVGYKARNMFTWNSPTALFDKEETQSIWRQNFKSIIFGLTVGVICLAFWQFTFFNERYLQPFIQPASSSTDAQIIIAPGEVKAVEDGFRVIIPKIGVDAPVVDGVKGFRTIDGSEPESAFENRVQAALEKGTVHYPGTQFPGQSGVNFNSNVVVLGHSASNIFAPGNYKSIFSRLQEMELGDFILVNYQRQQYIYKIYGKQVVKPTQVEVLQPGSRNNTLTLITCHPPGNSTNRLVLLAEQINPDPLINRSVEQNADSGNRETVVPGRPRGFFD